MLTQDKNKIITSYIVALSKQLSKIKKYIIKTQNKSLAKPVHNMQPKDYVPVKSCKKTL